MQSPVSVNPNVMHGTPCFAGTRVPVRSLFDHLEIGYTVDGFLEQFPSVKRELVLALLAQVRHRTDQEAEAAAR